MRRYRRTYAMLKAIGHSPTKALEILVDAKRGQRYALDWIRALHNLAWRRAESAAEQAA